MSEYYLKARRGDFELELRAPDKAFVDAYVRRFFADGQAGAPGAAQGKAKPAAPPHGARPASLIELKRRAKLDSGPDHVALVGYFLEKHEGQNEFASKRIVALLKDLRINLSNPYDAVAKARGAGYLMPGKTKGHFMLTDTGEKLVEDRLKTAAKESAPPTED